VIIFLPVSFIFKKKKMFLTGVYWFFSFIIKGIYVCNSSSIWFVVLC